MKVKALSTPMHGDDLKVDRAYLSWGWLKGKTQEGGLLVKYHSIRW